MERKRKRTLGGLAIAVAMSLGAGPVAAQTEIRMQSAWPATLPASGEIAERFANEVTTASGGDLAVKFYEPGALVPPLEILDAVSGGLVDAGFSTPAYDIGQRPVAAIFAGLPFGPEALEIIAWVYHGGGLEIWQDAYDDLGVVVMPCGLMEAEAGGWFTKEINSAEDLVGLRIRFAGLGAEALRRLGAAPTLMSGGDIFPSLERQVIDATEFSMPAIDRMMGFEAIAKHYYVPGWHQPTTFHELLINAETWEGLSDAQRTLIEMACRDATLWTRTMTLKDNGEALAHFEGEGVTIREFPDEVLDTLRQTVDEVIADERERDEGFKAGYDSLQSFLETTRPWRERNTLQ